MGQRIYVEVSLNVNRVHVVAKKLGLPHPRNSGNDGITSFLTKEDIAKWEQVNVSMLEFEDRLCVYLICKAGVREEMIYFS